MLRHAMKHSLKSLILALAGMSAAYAATTTTGHYTYTISSANMTVFCNPTGHPCTPKINGIALAAGDEVAAVDSTGTCIGSTKWHGTSIALPVMGYDNSGSSPISGLNAGQKIRLRIWDSAAKVEISVVHAHFAAHGSPIPNADSTYVANGMAVLDTLLGYMAPLAPALSSPASGAVNQPITPTLSWGSSAGATSYALQLSTVSTFASTVISQSGITTVSKALAGLGNNTKFFWRTNATDAGGTGAWSSVWNFTTIVAPPAAPVLSSPTNSATGEPSTLTLTWKTGAGATSYTVQVAAASTFATTFFNQSGITVSTRSITGLAKSTKYFWRVKASNAGGTGSWSTAWNFTISATGALAIGSTTGVGPAVEVSATPGTDAFLHHRELAYSLGSTCKVMVTLSDLRGRTVVLVNGAQGAGNYSVNLEKRAFAPGMFLVHFKAATADKTMAVILQDR